MWRKNTSDSPNLLPQIQTLPVYLEVLLVVVALDGLAARGAHVPLPELVGVLLPHALSVVIVDLSSGVLALALRTLYRRCLLLVPVLLVDSN